MAVPLSAAPPVADDRRVLTGWLPRLRRPRSLALDGTVAVLRLLPRVDARRTVLLAATTLVSAALPVAMGIVLGLLVGSVPAAAAGGMDSPAGRATLALFGVVCALA